MKFRRTKKCAGFWATLYIGIIFGLVTALFMLFGLAYRLLYVCMHVSHLEPYYLLKLLHKIIIVTRDFGVVFVSFSFTSFSYRYGACVYQWSQKKM